MKKALRLLALAVLAGAVVTWLVAGAYRGWWTQTSVPVKKVDEVTGIEGIDYQKRFLPGIDFLGVALLGAGALAVSSLFIRKKPNQN